MVSISKWVIAVALVSLMGGFTTSMNAPLLDTNFPEGIVRFDQGSTLSLWKEANSSLMTPYYLQRLDRKIKNMTTKMDSISPTFEAEELCQWMPILEEKCTISYAALCGPGVMLIKYHCMCLGKEALESTCQESKKPEVVTKSCDIDCETAHLVIIFVGYEVIIIIVVTLFPWRRLYDCNHDQENEEMEMEPYYIFMGAERSEETVEEFV